MYLQMSIVNYVLQLKPEYVECSEKTWNEARPTNNHSIQSGVAKAICESEYIEPKIFLCYLKKKGLGSIELS